ncbi:DDHD-domain-containing protein [Sporormia fimetaria CBS 119925]|uniref:DDHD-domain-containing protein n=1 Tax=Sporormia fimetaria CBS 119925 TaxID=1340428 RepID=A0A6A6V8I4_9PLEO|nr:DDHD-domain-containing protein [Sporormia fimetaria CBS 119925]
MSTPETKPGFLAAGINALSPWTPRSSTPKPPPIQTKDAEEKGALGRQRGTDHIVSHRPRISLKKYPSDCPPLEVRWFHAVDIPKRRPFPNTGPAPDDKPAPRPKKWIAFSAGDSRAIETAFQKQIDDDETDGQHTDAASPTTPTSKTGDASSRSATKVPVNEDYLFDVDVEARELAPAYWQGPVYEIKRGTWFTPDGEACEENLATQLEEGYLKIKPWRLAKPDEKRSSSLPRSRPVSLNTQTGEDYRKALNQGESTSNPITPKSSVGDLRAQAAKQDGQSSPGASVATPEDSPRAYRLFGAHMNSVVTYQDEKTAWVLTDDFLSRMGSTLYQRFAGGAHYAGAKYVRGFVDTSATKKPKVAKDGQEKKESQKIESSPLAYGEGPDGRPTTASSEPRSDTEEEREQTPAEAHRRTIERQMSSLIISSQTNNTQQQEEEIRKRDEQEMREDYKDQSKAEQGREIEHLLLVTHGIGQRLGMRMESVNFVHDVNSMRKSLKSVYANSVDLQNLNSEVDAEVKNSRIQVLPICWRHLLDFPKQSLRHNRREHDLADLDYDEDDYPQLDDITVEGVPAVRSLLTDLALDILLYQSPTYKAHISRIVLEECNRIYRLFKKRNPGFNGRVSLVGHSLGSAIMFDILCQQKTGPEGSQLPSKQRRTTDESLKLDFEVEDFYTLGSPIGLFQMLKGRKIAARPPHTPFVAPETPKTPLDDPFSPAASESLDHAFEITTASPACRQLFNVFHPTDPISYRLEPLISPAMSTLKPQPLPYTKKGIFGGSSAQGITGIGARVGQGVTDFWTSVSSGIASGLINRSLGISGTDAQKMSSDLTLGQRSSRPLSVPITDPVPPELEPAQAFVTEERKRRLAGRDTSIVKGSEGEHPPTLIDSEMETLYAGFQKRSASQTRDGEGGLRNSREEMEWQELEEKSRRLRKEEAKVRALNANGRVDYSIQEGAFDISLLASIASHLSYWTDEDVAHFMISQLLARHRVYRDGKEGEEGEKR